MTSGTSKGGAIANAVFTESATIETRYPETNASSIYCMLLWGKG